MKLQKKVYETRAEKKKDFLIGVGVFLGLNVLLYLLAILASFLTQTTTNDVKTIVFLGCWYILPFLANIGVIIYFALTRSWIAMGMLGTFGGLILLSLVLSCIASVVCFVLYSMAGGS